MPTGPEQFEGLKSLAEFTAHRSREDGEAMERFLDNLQDAIEQNPDVVVALTREMLMAVDDDVRELAAGVMLHRVAMRRPEAAPELYAEAFRDPTERIRQVAYYEFITMLKDGDVEIARYVPVLEIIHDFRDDLTLPEPELG